MTQPPVLVVLVERGECFLVRSVNLDPSFAFVRGRPFVGRVLVFLVFLLFRLVPGRSRQCSRVFSPHRVLRRYDDGSGRRRTERIFPRARSSSVSVSSPCASVIRTMPRGINPEKSRKDPTHHNLSTSAILFCLLLSVLSSFLERIRPQPCALHLDRRQQQLGFASSGTAVSICHFRSVRQSANPSVSQSTVL